MTDAGSRAWPLIRSIAFALLLTIAPAAADPLPGSSAVPERPTSLPAPSPSAASDQLPVVPVAVAAPQTLTPIEPGEAVAVLGKKVRGPDGKDVMGQVIDILVDGNGQPRAAIVDFGGFLGVGSRKIAVDWQLLQFKPADRDAPISLGLSRAEIQAAPEYKESTQPAEIVESPASTVTPASPDVGK